MLEVTALHAWYGKSHVLQGVDFTVDEGEIVSLLGRNGSGRSTLCKALMGLVTVQGSARLAGTELVGLATHAIARAGVGYVPEDRQIFAGLTTQQNLLLGRHGGTGPGWAPADAYALFPQLRERMHVDAAALSGGEQQMLAMCRTLMGNPRLLIVDEPTEGLAPQLVAQVGDFLLQVAASGVAVVLVEQKLGIAKRISRRAYVMGRGRIVHAGTVAELAADNAIRQSWLAV